MEDILNEKTIYPKEKIDFLLGNVINIEIDRECTT